MTVSIEFWHVVGYLLSFLGFCFTGAKILLSQYDKKLTENLSKIVHSQEKDSESLLSLERQFLQFQTEVSKDYVRREDYVRGQTVIEAKLDAINTRFENIFENMQKIGKKK